MRKIKRIAASLIAVGVLALCLGCPPPPPPGPPGPPPRGPGRRLQGRGIGKAYGLQDVGNRRGAETSAALGARPL